jgi:hypothetical protein
MRGTMLASARSYARSNRKAKRMLRSVGLIGASVLLMAAGTPPALERAFTGTVVSTYPDGRTAQLWLNRDGTYTSMGRRHDRHSGRWSVRGDRVCFRRGIFGYCTAIPTTTGASFTTRAVTGETIQVRLLPGRPGETAG